MAITFPSRVAVPFSKTGPTYNVPINPTVG
jgi:hypothetical protein